jgi:signal transduction histidine kinase
MQLSRRVSSLVAIMKPGVLIGIVLSLCVGALAYYLTAETIEKENDQRFQSMARVAQFNLDARIKSYTGMLRATASLFDASPDITREQFRRYVAGLDLPKHYPAIETLNFMQWVADKDRDAFEAHVRREQQNERDSGTPFRIRPPGRRPYYSVLIFVEPVVRWSDTIGLDLSAQPAMFHKLLESRDDGEITTSGVPVKAMLDKKRLGLAMRLSVYRPGMPISTVEQRRAAYIGSVGTAFSVERLIHGVLDDLPIRAVRLNLFNRIETLENAPSQLIYDSSAPETGRAPPQDLNDPNKYHVWLPVDFNGHPWLAHFSTPKETVRRPTDASFPLLAGVAGFASMMLLYGLYYTLTSSRSRAVELAQGMTKELLASQSELIRSHKELRQLAAHAEHIKEIERKRIAREIHDDLGQNLLALRIEAELLFSRTRDHHPRLNARAGATLGYIDATIKSVRQIINDLRPNVLDLGLNAAVDWQISEFQRRTGIKCDLVEYHRDIVIDDAFATALFRILQESLTNVQRHARANWVRVDLLVEHGWVRMSVRDDGLGLVTGRYKPGSYGLIGIEERVKVFGGTFSLSDAPGGGTVVEVALPIEQENSESASRNLPLVVEEYVEDELA